MLVEDLLEGQGAVALARPALAARAEDEAPDAAEQARETELGHHPVHAVDVLAHVLEEEDRPSKEGR